MPSFDLRDAITIITGIITLTGVVVTLRTSVAELRKDQGEVLRQVGALHKRMDDFGRRLTESEIKHARLDERVQGLRESQRFRLRPQVEGKQDMFSDPTG